MSRLVYRSHAISPMSETALGDLARAAQERNAAESVTGLILYDNSHFYQWLEGPTAGVDRVIDSISADPRHDDIHVLGQQSIQRRSFGAWTMRLAGAGLTAGPGGLTLPSHALLAALRLQPDDAPNLLATLASAQSTSTTDLIRDVLMASVIPGMATRRGIAAAAAHPRLDELVSVLAVGDAPAAAALIAAVRATASGPGMVFAGLAEPAAQRLGELWEVDSVTLPEVTAGLACLRAGLRWTSPAPPLSLAASGLRVLSAALPGEPHALGPVMHPELLADAGWRAEGTAAAETDALVGRLSDQAFDVLDLSLSATFVEPERLPEAAGLIALVRAQSRNPRLAIVLSGRAAATGVAAWAGADRLSRSAAALPRAIREAAQMRL